MVFPGRKAVFGDGRDVNEHHRFGASGHVGAVAAAEASNFVSAGGAPEWAFAAVAEFRVFGDLASVGVESIAMKGMVGVKGEIVAWLLVRPLGRERRQQSARGGHWRVFHGDGSGLAEQSMASDCVGADGLQCRCCSHALLGARALGKAQVREQSTGEPNWELEGEAKRAPEVQDLGS